LRLKEDLERFGKKGEFCKLQNKLDETEYLGKLKIRSLEEKIEKMNLETKDKTITFQIEMDSAEKEIKSLKKEIINYQHHKAGPLVSSKACE